MVIFAGGGEPEALGWGCPGLLSVAGVALAEVGECALESASCVGGKGHGLGAS
jgi:hypothetical protein